MPRKKKIKAVVPMTFTFRISESVRELLKERAAMEHSSESAVCNRILEAGLRDQGLAKKVTKLEARVRHLETLPRVLGLVLGDTPDKVLAMMENALNLSEDAEESVPKQVKRARATEAEAEEEAEETDAADDDGGTAGIDN